ncbi:MAG: glutaredoxin family protein [Moorea sp. SIO3C2]|nr:glutaredoxin family protein [Moorena sp. SIO3C2]
MSSTVPRQLVLYSKPGCHLCEGLQEKLEAIQQTDPCPLEFTLDIRDITTREDWFAAYQYEIPVLYWSLAEGSPPNTSSSASDGANPLIPIPRPSPRASVANVLKILQSSC